MKNRKMALAALGAVAAIAAGVGIAGNAPVRAADKSAPDVSGLVGEALAARSPGERAAAAVSTKSPLVEKVAWTPTYPMPSVASERTPVEKVAVSAVPPPEKTGSGETQQAAVPPAVLAPAPVPPTAVVAAGTVAAVPVAAAAVGGGGASLGAAALLPAVPAILAASSGGGGGGGGTLAVTPAVPEPATWMMMISGFGMLGFALRRRRRQDRSAASAKPGAASLAWAGQAER